VSPLPSATEIMSALDPGVMSWPGRVRVQLQNARICAPDATGNTNPAGDHIDHYRVP
jgi:hypothetical protein